MRTTTLVLLFPLSVAFVASSSKFQIPLRINPSGDDKTFIPFAEFVEQVQRAEYEDYKYSKVENEEAFEEMRKHILYMYDCVDTSATVTSFVQEQGYADCIKVTEQPSYCHFGLKEVPKPPLNSSHPTKSRNCVPGVFRDTDSPLKLGLKDRFGNSMSCPEGSIPMARLTLEKLTQFPNLRSFFAKRIPKKGRETTYSAAHKYAHASQQVSNFGGNSWLNVWNPETPSSDMSLSQHWYWGGPFETLEHQTVEGGWQVQPAYFNTGNAVLFIYWTADNYANSGCYDLTCDGFIQINNHWNFGSGFNHYSTAGGTQWGFEMQWKLYQDNWWLFLRGPGDYEAVGYYPTSIYNRGQLSRSAEGIDYGGETASPGAYPQMGSGQFSKFGWMQAAFHNQIFWIPQNENDGYGIWANLTAEQPSPSCYTADITEWDSGGDWGTYFYFGGPGGRGC